MYQHADVNSSPDFGDLIGVAPENIPDELKALRQWVCWKLEKDEKGEPTKVPYNPATGYGASHSDPKTWRDFERALRSYQRGGYEGIGFVFSEDDPYTGIDLDGCVGRETGEIAAWAREWVERFAGYAEFSPSGTGLHIIVKGKTPHNGKKKTADGKKVEIYSVKRFFTITGVRP